MYPYFRSLQAIDENNKGLLFIVPWCGCLRLRRLDITHERSVLSSDLPLSLSGIYICNNTTAIILSNTDQQFVNINRSHKHSRSVNNLETGLFHKLRRYLKEKKRQEYASRKIMTNKQIRIPNREKRKETPMQCTALTTIPPTGMNNTVQTTPDFPSWK